MSTSASTPALFRPIQVGDVTLGHRVVLAPLTRFRATKEQVPTDLVVEYYKQRASVPGTLLITEATYIARNAGGMSNAPGIYTDEQVAAWKKVVDVVHAQGSHIFLQLWALGRMARPGGLFQIDGDIPYVAPSPIPHPRTPDVVPRELTKEEIKEYVGWYAQAAENAVHRAGFDGVEIHGANGYLVDQFLSDLTNHRADEYGGSVENRTRFALEVVDAIAAKIGQSKTGIRLSPWFQGYFGDLRMEDPIPVFAYLVDQFKQRYPNLAYLHVVAPGAPYNLGHEDKSQNDFIFNLWAPRPVITAGGYDRESGLKVAEETGQIIGYGRAFLSNPDLPFRLREDVALNALEEETMYAREAVQGYTTYPFSEAFLKSGTRN